MNLKYNLLLNTKTKLNKILPINTTTFSKLWYKMRGKIRLDWRERIELHIDWK